MKKQIFQIVSGFILLLMFSMNSFTQDNLWKNWVKSNDNPITYPANTWFDEATNPIILYEDDKFKMWFTGYSENTNKWARQIGYAESVDGLSWQFHEDPVIECGPPGTSQRNKMIGNVLRVNDTLRIWYGGFTYDFKKYSTYYGWSSDGLEWTLHPIPVLWKGEPGQWDEEGAFGWPVYYDGATYHMYYSNHYDFGYATSPDGIHWEKDNENNPVFVRGPNGSWYDEWVIPGPVIVQDDVIFMFFSGSDGTGGAFCNGYFRVGYAWSRDYINWTIGNNMDYILNKGGPGDWDYEGASVTSVIYHDHQYKMWYSGVRQDWAMGYAGLVTDITELSKSDQASLKISPNPFTKDITITYSVSEKTNVKLEIYNLKGQLVLSLVNEVRQQGKYKAAFNGNELLAGTYFCVLETNDGTISKKFIKLD